jgi:hypothetical protein
LETIEIPSLHFHPKGEPSRLAANPRHLNRALGDRRIAFRRN